MKKPYVISAVIVCLVISIAAFLQASGIVPALVPALVPAANKNGNSSVFALASSNALTASSATCTDASGNLTTTACTANAVTSTTPVTVNTNTTSDQQLMELSLTAGYLNSLGREFTFFGAGLYTTQAAQTPTLTYKIKLCTVSGCGSGTVVTLINITSAATSAAQTNFPWNLTAVGTIATAGSTGNLEIHSPLNVTLGASQTGALTSYNDTNTAVSGNIDLTAALFVDFTVAFSTNAATANTCTQREGDVLPSGSTAGGGGSSVTVTPPYLLTGGNNYGPNWLLTIPPTAGWTNVNTATFDTTNGYPYVHKAAVSAAQISGIFRSAPATPWSVVVLMHHDWSSQLTSSFCGECMWSFGVSDGTKYTTLMGGITSTNFGTLATHWTNATTFSANAQTTSGASWVDLIARNPLWLKVCDDGTTNINFYWSLDGNHFVQIYTEGRVSFLASVADVFFGVYPNSGSVDAALLSYKTTTSCP